MMMMVMMMMMMMTSLLSVKFLSVADDVFFCLAC